MLQKNAQEKRHQKLENRVFLRALARFFAFLLQADRSEGRVRAIKIKLKAQKRSEHDL